MKKTRNQKKHVQKWISLAVCLVFIAVAPGAGIHAAAEEHNSGDNDTKTIASISAGKGHTLALKEDGTVWAWGRNIFGQLGDGTYDNQESPVQVSDLSDIVEITAGNYHSLAIASDGTVWAWGKNSYGQLGTGDREHKTTPIQVQRLRNITAVAAGAEHSLALGEDGTIYAWGNNEYGQLGDGTSTNRDTPRSVSYLRNGEAIGAGGHSSAAVRDDGTVQTWGANWSGQLGDGTTLNRYHPSQVEGLSEIISLSAGMDHMAALNKEGRVWTWGSNSSGQLGTGQTADSLTPRELHHIKNEQVLAIATGEEHTLAIREDNKVLAWGNNAYGQLGDGTTTERRVPAALNLVDRAIAISAGDEHSAMLRDDGSVWAWGSNWYGSLGDGTRDNSHSPVETLIRLKERPEPPAPENGIKEEKLELTPSPYLENGSVMVPLRSMAEALGADIRWDSQARAAIFYWEEAAISFSVGTSTVAVNGEEIALEKPVSLLEGRTFVPLTALGEALEVEMDWNSGQNAVYITSD